MGRGVIIVFAGSFAFAKAPAARTPADANPAPWLRREASGDEESTRQLLPQDVHVRIRVGAVLHDSVVLSI